MDYEKKYNEMVRRAKELHESGNALTRQQMEIVCPELRESEDERILNGLIAAMKDQISCGGESYFGMPLKDILAYLEKQKEFDKMIVVSPEVWDNAISDAFENEKKEGEKQKKQNGDTEEYTDFTIYHPFKNGKGEYECFPYSFYGSLTSFSENKALIDFLHTCFYTKEECEEWIEKKKEQKPAECIEDSIKFKEGFKAGRESGLRDGQKYVLNNLDSYGLCKPAEWNAEDSRILYNVIAYVGYAAGQRGVRDDEFKEANSWLKSLPMGFIVNPNYNEDMVNLLVGELQSIAERNGAPRQYDAEITWLKSLRPQFHWKPSEEQLRPLKYAIDYFKKKKNDTTYLESLLFDLQKLL